MELKSGYKQTGVGVIPEDWTPSRVADLGRVATGGTPRTGIRSFWNGDIPWVTPTDIIGSRDMWSSERGLTQKGLEAIRGLPGGSVLVTCIASIGKNAILKVEGGCNQQINAVVPNRNNNAEFLYYLFEASKQYLLANAGMTATSILSKAAFQELRFAVPPLPEQRAIAEALGDVDALLGALTQLIAKKRDLRRAAMQQLLTGQTRLPGFSGKWEVKRLGVMGTCLRGVSYRGDGDLFPHDTAQTKRLLRANNVRGSAVVTSDIQFVDAARVSAQQLLRENDILICMANGSKALVGKAGLFRVSDGYEYTFGAFMGCFRANSAASNPTFISFLFQTGRYRDYINNLLAGSSINNVRPSAIESLEFLFPPLVECTAMVAVLSDMDAELTALEQRLAKTRALKQGMMQELLTGRTRLV